MASSVTFPRSPRLRSLASALITAQQENLNLLAQRSFSVSETALSLGVSPQTVRLWIRHGDIAATRVGKLGKFRIPASQIEKLKGRKT